MKDCWPRCQFSAVLHLLQLPKTGSSDTHNVKPAKPLAWASLASALTCLTPASPHLASNGFYHLSSRNYLRCFQETRRSKRVPCLSVCPMHIAPFSWTSCRNGGHLMNSLLHNFFWALPVFLCCCPPCPGPSSLSLQLVGGALSYLSSLSQAHGEHGSCQWWCRQAG